METPDLSRAAARSGRSRTWGAVVAACAAAPHVPAWGAPRPELPRRGCTLGDGSVVTLHGVTFGARHRCPVRLLRSWGARTAAPCRYVAVTPPGRLVVWMTRRDPRMGGYVDVGLDTSGSLARDQHGCLFANVGSASHRHGDVEVRHYVLSAFPRRARTFTLLVLESDGGPGGPVFTVANPVRGPFPKWRPDPPGALRRDGDLSARLVSARADEHWPLLAWRWPPRLTLDFDLTRGGKPVGDSASVPRRIVLRDATGNITEGAPWLCYREPAWRARVSFIRQAEASFARDEMWDLGMVDLPDPQQARRLDREETVRGVRLRALAIRRARLFQHSGGVRADATIDVEASGLGDNKALIVLATDDQGRRVTAFESWRWCDGIWAVGLMVPQGARRLHLWLMVDCCRAVELVLKPPAPIHHPSP